MERAYPVRDLPINRPKFLVRLNEADERLAQKIAHDRGGIRNAHTVLQNPEQQLQGARCEVGVCKGFDVPVELLLEPGWFDAVVGGQRCDIKGYLPHYRHLIVPYTLAYLYEKRDFDWFLPAVAHPDGVIEWIGALSKRDFINCHGISPGREHGHELDAGTLYVRFRRLDRPTQWCREAGARWLYP